ncbi:LLLL and CFNLAS motif-containing protein 1 isoform X1 [Mastomys coucha]|uniref:LLLL and CFNLAS motif-containing protein 1 isoform X1 n=1 Tax=Mastomys coucha TaxID=35658 RepID=UPI0012623282|nr:LLLL and CFNLAS motif-containing protein 1 isoform X1 [Mastomys coucha]
MKEKEEKRCWQELHRATLLTAMLLLLQVKGVKTLKGSASLDGDKSQKEQKFSEDQGKEEYEEHFMVSSVGDQWQEINMVQQDMISQAITLRDHLFDLAFCFNLASFMFFL